ncbi:MAG: UDP-N-acetylglucosamine 2-epimerase (non-hydrolyzing) [Bacteroidetes bacterium]|nr:UDP-N-acetylglucosamine 2-epimerase (non-hydrolyzing) [Bacteroidota bacterium]
MKILTIVGARPQIIKAAALSRAIRTHFSGQIKETILHTGQHYDANMSQVFFDELEIPAPDINLNIGSASHGKQTAQMIQGIEAELEKLRPDYLVLYGDTNSTLAGAISAAKMRIPIVHIEAGLRSFNKSMPEEVNRIMCDHASTLLFVPTPAGMNNLSKEGFNLHATAPFTSDNPGVFHCGDIMFDNLVYFSELAEKRSDIISRLGLTDGNFVLCTIHRDNNTDIPERLSAIFSAMIRIADTYGQQIVIPLHPRTSKLLPEMLPGKLYEKLMNHTSIRIIPPVSYLEMILLEKHCSQVLTDSGGVQKEAYFFQKPLIVARPETEWIEIIHNGAGIIANAYEDKICSAFEHFSRIGLEFPSIFGDGNAAHFICSQLLNNSERY